MRAVRHPRGSSGFALMLVLLGVVGFVVAFVLYGTLGTVLKHLGQNTENRQSFTKLDEAIVRFVIANKRLPCPASGTASGAAEGSADPDSATITCNSPSGVVPWRTLALSRSDALDSWGRYLSYRVYDGAGGFTGGTAFDVSSCQNEKTLTGYPGAGTCPVTRENTVADFLVGKGLTVNDLGVVKTGVAYVLISHGESGDGAYYPGATATIPLSSSSSQEFQTAGSGGTYWIVPPSAPDVPASSANHFDDWLSYTDAAALADATRFPRAWPLGVAFNGTTVLSGSTSFLKVTSLVLPSGAVPPVGAVGVTASADSARTVCLADSTPPGIAPCIGANPNSRLDMTANEKLTFDFHVKRTQFLIMLADFEAHDGEQAQLTFYNGATQVGSAVTLAACDLPGLNKTSKFRVTPSAAFTKVDIRALPKPGGGSSKMTVSEVAACHSSSLAPCKLSVDAVVSAYCP